MNLTQECHMCGGEARLVRDQMQIHIGHRVASIAADRMRCKACRAEFFLPGQMHAAQKLAADQLRAEEGLLAPADVKGIRAMYAWSQADLERVLGAGSKTVIRWERGTVFQSKSTDALLRVLRDVPEAAAYLASRNGMPIRMQRLADSPSPDIEPSWTVLFELDIAAAVKHEANVSNPTPAEDPKVVSLDRYRATRPLEPIPPSLLERAQL